jgi:DNA topoisomerase-1
LHNYIKTISGGDFTAKDFRTWAGTIQAFLAFKDLGGYQSESEMNKKIVAAIDTVAQQLGNTRAVCKKYYVHPVIIDLYKENQLQPFYNQLETLEPEKGLSPEEQILIQILEKKL